MIDSTGAKSLTLPEPVAHLYEQATDQGWDARITFHAGPPTNITLHARQGHRTRTWLWHLEGNEARLIRGTHPHHRRAAA